MELQSEQFLQCPYCGERISMVVDESIDAQSYIEDCEVCCRPIAVTCSIEGDGTVRLEGCRSDD